MFRVGEADVNVQGFFTAALVGGERSVKRPDRLTPEERSHISVG
jgi:hypothetical protein